MYTEPLLRNGREVRGYTSAVSEQWLGKNVPVARQQILNNEPVGLQQWKTVFSTWSMPRGYK
jgi:hypothetical protein